MTPKYFQRNEIVHDGNVKSKSLKTYNLNTLDTVWLNSPHRLRHSRHSNKCNLMFLALICTIALSNTVWL